MLRLAHRWVILVSVLGLCGPVLVADAASASAKKAVRTNPFAQPLMVEPASARRGSAQAIGERTAVAALQLRGVLQAGADSFANVDGIIVGLGETVSGMRLQSVSDSAAVFMLDGKKVVLDVSSPQLAGPSAGPALAPGRRFSGSREP